MIRKVKRKLYYFGVDFGKGKDICIINGKVVDKQ